MSWGSAEADALFDLTDVMDILEEVNPDLAKMFEGHNPLDFAQATLKDLNIGGEPIGHGELLELMDKIEHKLGIRFTPDELPDFFQSQEITLRQIVEQIAVKRWGLRQNALPT